MALVKKQDVQPVENVVERFFQLPANASPQLIRIIKDLRAKEKEHPFIEAFVAGVGYPKWGYAKIKKVKPKGNVFSKGTNYAIVEIPIVQDETKFVKALLEVKLDTETMYKLFEGQQWENYGFDKDAALNADKVVTRLMEYEKAIWNTQFFKIADNRLFNYWPAGIDKPASFFVAIQTNDVSTDKIVYVYSECEAPGGSTDGGGTGEGDDEDNWTYTNGGQIVGGHAPDQPYTWVEPNPSGSTGTTGTAVQVICLTDIVHITEGSSGTGWSTTPLYTNSGGSSNAGGSGGGDAPCTPFPWIGLGIRTGSGQYQALFNPCFEEVPPPLDVTAFPINSTNLVYGMGPKPLKEYSADNRCAGLQEMWNDYPNNEAVGFVTKDGKLIVTGVVDVEGGGFKGLYRYENLVTGLDEYYYTYPVSEGAPSLTYDGMLTRGDHYYIPLAASVHTHTPCRTDGTDGVSHDVSDEDETLASNYQQLKNWIIGCNAIAQFNNTSDDFFDKHEGPISTTCSFIP